jgi:carboxyl-terminal processing protease
MRLIAGLTSRQRCFEVLHFETSAGINPSLLLLHIFMHTLLSPTLKRTLRLIFIPVALIALATVLLGAPQSKPAAAESQKPKPKYDLKSIQRHAKKLPRPSLNKFVFTAAWLVVNEGFYDPNFNGHDWAALRKKHEPAAVAAKDEAALYTTINDMLDELGVSHLTARSPTAVRAIKKAGSKTPSLSGLITLSLPPDGTSVVWVVRPNSPAQKAGIKRGWVHLDEPPKDTDVQPKEGDTIQLKFLDEHDKPRTVKIKLRNTPTMGMERDAQILSGRVLYLNFERFDDKSAKWMREQLTKHADTVGTIIDLRLNIGGELDATSQLLGNFFPEPVKFGTFKKRDESAREYASIPQSGGTHYKGRVAVLVSRSSACGAELFAAAMQHYRRGSVVGSTSTGRTSGQLLGGIDVELPDGGELLVPIVDFVFVDGTRIEGTGVRVDVSAPAPTVESIRAGKDEAIEIGARIATGTEATAP